MNRGLPNPVSANTTEFQRLLQQFRFNTAYGGYIRGEQHVLRVKPYPAEKEGCVDLLVTILPLTFASKQSEMVLGLQRQADDFDVVHKTAINERGLGWFKGVPEGEYRIQLIESQVIIDLQIPSLAGVAAAAKGGQFTVDAEKTTKEYAVEESDSRLTVFQDEDESWIVSYRTTRGDLAGGKISLVILTAEEMEAVVKETLPLVPARGEIWAVRYTLPKRIDLRRSYKLEISPVLSKE